MDKPLHIFRVEVLEWPEGCHTRGWVPKDYDGPRTRFRYDDGGGFRWPRRMNYFNRYTAQDVANTFNEYGAVAVVRKSDPITFDGLLPVEEVREKIKEVKAAEHRKVVTGMMRILEDTDE